MDEQAFGITMLGRPLFTSLFVGLILGDVQQGVIVGAALESMFMGAIMVGAAVPPEVYASGVLGCAFAVITGTGTATAVALALPVSVFLLYSVINFATRIVAAHLGYDLGTKFLQQTEENNLMSRMTHAAGVLGMTVIGAMIAAQVSLSTALTFDVGGSEIVLQDLFDSIFPDQPALAGNLCLRRPLQKGRQDHLDHLGHLCDLHYRNGLGSVRSGVMLTAMLARWITN